MRRQRLLWVLPFLLFAAACSRCGGPGAVGAKTELIRLLPKNAEAILLVPDVALLGERLSSLERLKLANFAAQLQGMPSAKDLSAAIAQQVGVDIRSREGLERAGFDPSRGMGMVLLDGDLGYSVIAINDAKKFRSMVEKLTRDRLGVTTVETQSEGNAELTRFVSPRGLEAAMVVKDGFAAIAARSFAERLAQVMTLAPGTSLADDPGFAASLARLPKDRHLVAYLPPSSKMAGRSYLHGATFGAHLADDDLSLVMDLPWPDTRASLAALGKKEGASPYGVLPADAFAMARFAGDFTALNGIWPYLTGQRLAQQLTEAGLDVNSEVLGNLEPGGVLSLSLSPIVNFSSGLSLNVRRSNPFRMVHPVAAARVKDAAKARATLEKVPPLSPRLGATVTGEERNGQQLYLTRYSQGEGLHFALAGSTLVAASPEPRLLDALAAAKAGGGEAPLTDPALRAALEQDVFTFAIDLRKLAAQVEALPSSAWGVGGFAIKATTVRWLAATDDLTAITGSLATQDKALQAQLHLRLAKQ